MTQVAVFGGGVAGLTAAQELGERGYQVNLFEQAQSIGGKARSFPFPGTGQGGRDDLPGEHGFRFYPGFYKHVPDTMSRIPLPGGGFVVDNLTDVPTFSLAFDNAPPLTMAANVNNPNLPEDWGLAIADLVSAQKVGLTLDDALFFASRILCAWCSCDARRAEQYENMNWPAYIEVNKRGAAYDRVFSKGLARPLVALSASQCNARSALTVLLQILQDILLTTADRVLNGPTSEAWIGPWGAYLSSLGTVTLNCGASAVEIAMQGNKIDHVVVKTDGGTIDVTADYYVFAVPFEVMKNLITAGMLAAAPELAGIANLNKSWMTGLIFYYSDAVQLDEGHTIYTDSPWALTSISELPFWAQVNGANIGGGNVGTIFSTIVSNWDSPGIGIAKHARQCTFPELVQEVLLQINMHRQNMPTGQLNNAALLDTFLDPAISFDGAGAVSGNSEPLLINTVGSYASRPPAVTSIPNLFLAGDYVKTMTNLATMEGACEAGRTAALGLLIRDNWNAGPRPQLFPLIEPAVFAPFKALDATVNFPLGWPPPCPTSLNILKEHWMKRDACVR